MDKVHELVNVSKATLEEYILTKRADIYEFIHQKPVDEYSLLLLSLNMIEYFSDGQMSGEEKRELTIYVAKLLMNNLKENHALTKPMEEKIFAFLDDAESVERLANCFIMISNLPHLLQIKFEWMKSLNQTEVSCFGLCKTKEAKAADKIKSKAQKAEIKSISDKRKLEDKRLQLEEKQKQLEEKMKLGAERKETKAQLKAKKKAVNVAKKQAKRDLKEKNKREKKQGNGKEEEL